MNITLAVLADYANVSREGKLNIMGFFDVIHAAVFPSVHPQMQLVLRIEADALEMRRPRNIQVVFADEDGRQIFEIGGPLQMPPAPTTASFHMNQIFMLNGVQLPKAGDYEFKVLISDDLKATVPLKVIAIELNPAPQSHA